MIRPQPPEGVRSVRETPLDLDIPAYAVPGWSERVPWLFQATTAPGASADFDFGLFGEAPIGSAVRRWRRLLRATGFARAVHAHQTHGARVAAHGEGPQGLSVIFDHDGHVTRSPDLLLTVSVADCVPVSLVAPEVRAVALLHAGWRGTAAGILEAGLDALRTLGAEPERLLVHLGPAICGACYEVGPEVHEALDLDVPETNTPLDLRAALARRALARGVPAGSIGVSEHCTRCGATPFYSHRAGQRGRQLGLLGIRAQT